MNARPRLRSSLSVGFTFLSLNVAFLLVGCGRVPGQFEILNNQVPDTSGGCSIPAEPTVYQGKGTLDVGIVNNTFHSAYLVFPLIENNLSGTGAANDPNQIQLSGFDVDITPIGDATAAAAQVLNSASPSLLHFRIPWSGGVSSNGGKISAVVEAVPVDLALQLAGAGGLGAAGGLDLNIKIQALGTTNSGRSLTSDPFNYPVDVCNGCLIGNVAPCPYKPANTGNPCNPAQDEVVDCCTNNGDLVCPAGGIAP